MTVSANTESVPTNSDTVIPQPVFPVYKKAMYPDKNVRFIECTDVDGTQIVRLLVCPFEFDANIVVTPLNGGRRTEVKLNQNVNNISVDKSKFNEGVNVITLYVDGNKVDSKTINI